MSSSSFTIPFFPEEASTVAREVDAMYGVWIAISVFFTLLIAGLIVYFMVRYRRRAPDEVGASEHAGYWLEITWSAIPLLIMLVMFAWGARLFFVTHRPPANAVQYWAIGKQWMWKFQHPEGNREINHLHLPIGQTVKLTMTSEDVIHAFGVPAFRLKQDVVPGTYTTLWFTPNRVGEYHLFCNQYCGAEHSKMVGSVIVMEPRDYAAWVAGGPATGESPVVAGAVLFQNLACITCHTAGPEHLGRGPSLQGIFGKLQALEGGGTVIADEAYIRESILLPMAKVVKGYQPIMPTFQGQVTEEQITELIAYIKSLGGQMAPGDLGAPAAAGTTGATGTNASTPPARAAGARSGAGNSR